jgi:hypothetical protein
VISASWRSFKIVIAGLDPPIQSPFAKTLSGLAKKMDARVKPVHDDAEERF